jgi:sirohydrochlorin ferrochelatase
VEPEKKVGLIVFGHGSSIEQANEGVRRVAERTARRCRLSLWEAAFLELAQPSLESAVGTLVRKGAGKIVVAPYFLTMGVHLQRDLPRIIEVISTKHPGVNLVCSPPLDRHPALVDILADRVQQTIA